MTQQQEVVKLPDDSIMKRMIALALCLTPGVSTPVLADVVHDLKAAEEVLGIDFPIKQLLSGLSAESNRYMPKLGRRRWICRIPGCSSSACGFDSISEVMGNSNGKSLQVLCTANEHGV